MKNISLLGIRINPKDRRSVLEQIKKYLSHPRDSFQVISLNPENLVVAYENKDFKRVVETSQTQIVDGIGVELAGKMLGLDLERFTGVDLMEGLIKLAGKLRLRVLLVGGRANLALRLAECYSQSYAQASFKGIEGITNIKNPLQEEEKEIFSIVTGFKPHILLVAFGSPDQELWLDRHKDQFAGIVTMGVGGAFDYLSGKITRAPTFFRSVGLEWLFRLIREPWRSRRQVRLVKFVYLVLVQKLKSFLPNVDLQVY